MIWIKEYPAQFVGTKFNARMTVVRIEDDGLLLHSPCNIDHETKQELDKLGKVRYIVAPGSHHYDHIESAQSAFKSAETLICPGIELKRPGLKFDYFLGDRPDRRLESEFEQLLIRGNRLIWEVVFLHKPSKTLILVDTVEHITEKTAYINLYIVFLWKYVFRMWRKPRPSPSYQIGWKNRDAATMCFKEILKWDFDKLIFSHGDLPDKDVKELLSEAWNIPLQFHNKPQHKDAADAAPM